MSISSSTFRSCVRAVMISLFLLGSSAYGQKAQANPSSEQPSSIQVNINTASAARLADEIKGVGPRLAKRIVDYRLKNGPFESVEQLARVRGIGSRLIESNRDKLKVE